MRKLIAVLILTAGVAGCDVASVLIDGIKKTKAVGADLEQVTGLKPEVGFNWHNGRLTTVTVQFPRLYEDKPMSELVGLVRSTVTRDFKQTPERIVLAFALDK